MKTRLMEVSDGANWAKILVGRFETADLTQRSLVRDDVTLLAAVEANRNLKTGSANQKWLVHDLQTEEGGLFCPSSEPGAAKADLDRHALWVCPLFEPFLDWLYQWCTRLAASVVVHRTTFLDELPSLVELSHSEYPKLQGYRRSGEIAGIAAIRDKLIVALQGAPQLPATFVQMRVWVLEVLPPPESALLSTFFLSLASTEAARWIGALMADSGRFFSIQAGPGQIAMVPR